MFVVFLCFVTCTLVISACLVWIWYLSPSFVFSSCRLLSVCEYPCRVLVLIVMFWFSWSCFWVHYQHSVTVFAGMRRQVQIRWSFNQRAFTTAAWIQIRENHWLAIRQERVTYNNRQPSKTKTQVIYSTNDTNKKQVCKQKRCAQWCATHWTAPPSVLFMLF